MYGKKADNHAVYYEDSDGDKIEINNDESLEVCISEMQLINAENPTLKLALEPKTESQLASPHSEKTEEDFKEVDVTEKEVSEKESEPSIFEDHQNQISDEEYTRLLQASQEYEANEKFEEEAMQVPVVDIEIDSSDLAAGLERVQDFVKRFGPNVQAEIVEARIETKEKAVEETLEQKIARLVDEKVEKAVSEKMSTLQSLPTESCEQLEPEDLKPQAVHPHIICDSCGMAPIRGTRYKCLTCHDYDLCSNCEKTTHRDHPMARFHQPSRTHFPFWGKVNQMFKGVTSQQNKKHCGQRAHCGKRQHQQMPPFPPHPMFRHIRNMFPQSPEAMNCWNKVNDQLKTVFPNLDIKIKTPNMKKEEKVEKKPEEKPTEKVEEKPVEKVEEKNDDITEDIKDENVEQLASMFLQFTEPEITQFVKSHPNKSLHELINLFVDEKLN